MSARANIYLFDSTIAAISARESLDKNQIFFYDGEKLEDAPQNCINVRLDDFVAYFLTSPYPYPQEINFDNMDFSTQVQHKIIESLTDALATVKNQKSKKLTPILENEISKEDINESLFCMLEYISLNGILDTLPFALIYKLLEATKVIKSEKINLQERVYKIISRLFLDIESYYRDEIGKNLYLIHLRYILALLGENFRDSDMKIYFRAIAQFEDLEQLQVDFILIKMIFPQERLDEYIFNLSAALFEEDFFKKDILKQKHTIYKLFYLTIMNYARGEVYKEIFKRVYEIFKIAIKNDLDELVFYLYTPLIISWSGTSQRQEELKYFNEIIEKPLENFILKSLIPKYNIKQNSKKINPNKKVKVAFLQERMINYSIYKVFYLLIKLLKAYKQERYEFVIYDLNFKEFGGSNSESVAALKELGVKYVDLHKEAFGSLDDEFYPIIQKSLKIRRRVIKDKIDILIGMHSRPEYNFLFSTRVAPVQIYWSHGNFEYDIEAIDKKISHSGALSNANLYEIFNLPIELDDYNPKIDKNIIQKTRELYAKDSFILGSIGRLIKLDNIEYIQTIATIMKQHPNTIYLACGDGDRSKIAVMLKDFGIEDRFYFTGKVDADIYGHIIDLWLTPFPFGGGRALQEYIYKGKPYVILSTLFEKNVAIYRSHDIVESLKKEEDEFVLKEIYTQEDIYNIKTKGYLFEQNRYFQTYSGLPFVKDMDDYIKMAHLLITDQEIAQKIAKETLYKAKKSTLRGVHTFLELLE